MRGHHWTQVGVTTVLLLAEVAIAQLCKSPITLLDGFHTLYLLLNELSVAKSLFSEEPPSHSPLAPGLDYSHVPDVDYRAMRAQPVGAFISNLVLLSLNVIYLTEICSFMLEPAAAQRPLLLVATGAASLVFKMFLLGLHWHHAQRGRSELATESHIEVNPNALTAEEKAQAEQGGVFNNNEPNGLHLDGSQQDTALTVRNSNIPQEELHMNGTYDQAPADVPPPPSRPEASPHSLRSPWSHIGETLIIPFLVLVTGLATLSPLCLHSSTLCRSLVYLDPVLSLLAVLLLIAKALPPVFRYGLLLLQGAPPHFSLDEVGRKIMDVPGVEALHELHVWKLTETFIVASVHVHCDASLQNRCLDVMLGVTKVLQSEGVNCCTVQPEFTEQDASLQPCSLACAEACAGSMCCSQLAKQHKAITSITSGRTQEENSAGLDHITAVH